MVKLVAAASTSILTENASKNNAGATGLVSPTTLFILVSSRIGQNNAERTADAHKKKSLVCECVLTFALLSNKVLVVTTVVSYGSRYHGAIPDRIHTFTLF